MAQNASEQTQQKVLVFDFGAQYAQLIARRVRDLHVYSEIVPCDITADEVREMAPSALILSGEDIGFIIGHRGETLDALQYLASLVANHVDGSYFRVTLDVGNYREKRKETLEALGKKMAARAVKTGRNSSLEPMNPYERRIIHTAVQTVEGAKSWSEGVDQGRHVVIGPEGGDKGGTVIAQGTPEELFTKAELLRANHLRLPRIAHLMAILRDRDGLDVTPVGTIGAARRELLRLLKQEELL